MATKKSTKPQTSPAIPKEIFAQVSPKSIGGRSLFEEGEMATHQTIENYLSEREVTLRAVEDLKNAGFTILQVTNITINISGSQSAFEKAFGRDIHAVEMEGLKSGPEEDTITYLDTAQNDVLGLIVPQSGKLSNYIEGVALETPYYPFAPATLPPTKAYWHLNVPADVSLGCNADKAHRAGITGKGVHVVMVDTGFYRHPFYAARGYRANNVVLAPGTTDPTVDDNGHGTGEAANIFATAPDVDLTPMKWNFVNSTAAFNAAAAIVPDIITCSWGSSQRDSLTAANQTLAAAVAAAVANGITVVFSAGNGHYGFPGQHPDVISAGGVYMDESMQLQASNYSSGFDSNIYPGRRVPDVCGLVGQRPKAAYIMLPQQEGANIDSDNAGGTHPNGDETSASDGWAAFSGTSAAAPQLAGVAALIKQACRRLKPAAIRTIMKQTAKDVTTGTSATGTSSVDGPDNSTGDGLVDAYRAAIRARLSCVVVQPVVPVVPVVPIDPIRPIIPVNPINPIQPIVPILPVNPVNPVRPVVPTPPTPPIGPVISNQEVANLETSANLAESQTTLLSSEEIDEVMNMLEDGTLNFDDLPR
jgi:hypothetical protein